MREHVEARHEQELVAARRLVRSIAIVFVGTLAALSLTALVPSPDVRPLLSTPLLVPVALGAARALGPGTLRASLAGGTGFLGFAAGLVAGTLGFGLSWGYVRALQLWAGVESKALAGDLALAVLAAVVLAPLIEEWLCRGVLWLALRRALGAGWTVLVSAVLFAFLHGLGGAGLFEYPHRFALGLILGALRARSGSLLPGVLAHALANALALATWSSGAP